jgi:hypothetical protein
MQLDLLLKTYYTYVSNPQNQIVNVLYKTTTQKHRDSYEKLKQTYKFLNVNFVEETNFKKDLLKIFEDNFMMQYTLMFVDDCIITNGFDIELMEKTIREDKKGKLIGFSLRLGTNINYCYPHNSKQPFPKNYENHSSGVITYSWIPPNAEYDFAYPLELSSTLFETKLIHNLARNFDYRSPNDLEGIMYQCLPIFVHKCNLAMFNESVAFCNPINTVTTTATNRKGMDENLNPEKLVDLFLEGKRIDAYPFHRLTVNSPHTEKELRFV